MTSRVGSSIPQTCVKDHAVKTYTQSTDASTLDYILPSIHQLNPEVDTAFSPEESTIPRKKFAECASMSPYLLSPPVPSPSSLLASTDDHPSEDMSTESRYSRSPSRSEYSHSSKTSSDSEEEQPLQTPGNASATLGLRIQSKDDNSQTKHPYICPYSSCGWSFKRYEHLKRHQLVHTKERPFVCEFPNCGKSFSRSDNYSAHFRTHQRRRSVVETIPQSSIEKINENRETPSLVERRRSLAVGEEFGNAHTTMINPKFQLKHLSVPSPNEVENSLISPSKISNIHQLLNGNEVASANSYRYKRRYSEHAVLSGEENPTKIPNWGRTERRHSIAVMTSVPNDFEVASYLPSSSQSSHTLPPNALRHLYPQSHPHVHSLSQLSPHVYPQHHAQGQSLPFLATHYTHVHSVVGAPLATIEESPPHHIPTTTTAPRTSAAKNHVCTVAGCNMRFKRLEHLKRHMRVHTLERPFACAYVGCRKTFSRRDNLGQHMRTHERQALKQVQGDTLMMAQSTIRSAPLGLGIGHAGHVRQKST